MVVDAKPEDQKLPTDAYFAVEEVHDVSLLEHKLMWYVHPGAPAVRIRSLSKSLKHLAIMKNHILYSRNLYREKSFVIFAV